MIGDMAKWAVLAHCRELAFSPRPTISVRCNPLQYKDGGADAGEDIRHCDMVVKVSAEMQRKGKSETEKEIIYKVSSDIINNRCIRERSYEKFLELCEKNEVAEFIRKFYHIDKKKFERARIHTGTQFFYSLDYDMYEAEVKKKGKVYYNPFFIPEDKEG